MFKIFTVMTGLWRQCDRCFADVKNVGEGVSKTIGAIKGLLSANGLL